LCAPLNTSSMLVIDAETEAVHTIACGIEDEAKWQGIAAVGTDLFCAPINASSVLVIDADCSSSQEAELAGNFRSLAPAWDGRSMAGPGRLLTEYVTEMFRAA
jgi:hypothetical protein